MNLSYSVNSFKRENSLESFWGKVPFHNVQKQALLDKIRQHHFVYL